MKRFKKDLVQEYFPALKHKNFRYFWFGQCVSLVGTWMQNTGQAWLVQKLTNSSLKLGYVTALQFTPILLFSLFTGVLIERFNKKNILLFTQTSFMILAIVLTLLVWSGKIEYHHILIMSFLLGCINTIDVPTRQSFIIELVGKEHLMNGIALNSTVFNIARLLGPMLAGNLMYYLGFTECFLLNAISFIPVIYGIYNINVENKDKEIDNQRNSISYEIKDGIKYICKKPTLVICFIFTFILGVLAYNYQVLIPTFVANVIKGNEKDYGNLMSCLGFGSLIGALFVAVKSKKGPNVKKIYVASILIGFILSFMYFSKGVYSMGILLLIIGFCNIQFSTTANSSIQLNSSNEYRGRTMSVYNLVFTGSAPIGSLLVGFIGKNLGVSYSFLISGISILISVLILTFFISKNKEKLI